MRYLSFYLQYKLNFNNNYEKMHKSTIDWNKIMIISKTFDKNPLDKEFDGRKDILVRF